MEEIVEHLGEMIMEEVPALAVLAFFMAVSSCGVRRMERTS